MAIRADRLVVSHTSNRIITHFFTATQNTTERVEEKNKWTNAGLNQLQAQEGLLGFMAYQPL